jgi:hypothetical protein
LILSLTAQQGLAFSFLGVVVPMSKRYSPHGQGYILVFRKMLTSTAFQDEGTLKVWIWCLLRANFHPQPLDWGGEQVELKRGEFVTGRISAAEELRMSPSRVYRLLKKLESWGNISLKSNTHFTVVSVLQYDDYQLSGNGIGQPSNNQRTTGEQPTDTDKNRRIKQTKKTDIDTSTEFEILWKAYPNRQGKKAALRHFSASVKTADDLNRINVALQNYLKSGNVKNGFVKNGSTWFNEWQDWVEPTETMMKGNSNGARKGYRFDASKYPTLQGQKSKP